MNDHPCNSGKSCGLATQLRRFLKLLSRKSRNGVAISLSGDDVAVSIADQVFRFSKAVPRAAIDEDYVSVAGNRFFLTEKGRKALEHLLKDNGCENNPVARKTDDKSPNRISIKPGFNPAESPLSRLFTRKHQGKTYISRPEFEAGERLRADFEKGQLQPSITANPSFQPAGSSKGGVRGSGSDISDFAMDARARVTKAVHFLGPELAGVALDVCCFLKGLEQVERERQWPPRSAKLMLRTALSRLSEHYGMQKQTRASATSISSWADADFRPSLFGVQADETP